MEQKNTHGDKGPMRFLLFSASLRKESFNTRLARLAKEIIEKNAGIVDFAGMDEFDCPSYDGDAETESGIPKGADEFNKRILANDALVICSPEYNGSMPGLLKNVIDWVSRFRPQPFNEKQTLLLSASPSMAGGNRGLWVLRVPLEHLGARVFPNMFSLATAHKAFNNDGKLIDETLVKRFADAVSGFMDLAEAQRNYPCIRKAWVEFLGEKADPAIDRAEI